MWNWFSQSRDEEEDDDDKIYTGTSESRARIMLECAKRLPNTTNKCIVQAMDEELNTADLGLRRKESYYVARIIHALEKESGEAEVIFFSCRNCLREVRFDECLCGPWTWSIPLYFCYLSVRMPVCTDAFDNTYFFLFFFSDFVSVLLFFLFLDATTHLSTRSRRSVRPSVHCYFLKTKKDILRAKIK